MSDRQVYSGHSPRRVKVCTNMKNEKSLRYYARADSVWFPREDCPLIVHAEDSFTMPFKRKCVCLSVKQSPEQERKVCKQEVFENRKTRGMCAQ